MSTLILLAIVFSFFFFLFSEGGRLGEEGQVHENRARFAGWARDFLSSLAREHGDSLMELQALLKGDKLQFATQRHSELRYNEEGEEEYWFSHLTVTAEGAGPAVQKWLQENSKILETILQRKGGNWTVDFSEGLYAAIKNLQNQNPTVHEKWTIGRGYTAVTRYIQLENGDFQVVA